MNVRKLVIPNTPAGRRVLEIAMRIVLAARAKRAGKVA